MKYYQQLPDSTAVMWRDDTGNSGLVKKGDVDWCEYQAFLAEGGEVTVSPVVMQWTLADALCAISAEVAKMTREVKKTAPSAPSYAITEAQAWLLDNNTLTPFVDELLMPWEDKAEFCAQLTLQANDFRRETGAIAYWQRIAEAAMEAYFASGPRSSMTIRYPEVPSAS